MRTVHFAGWPNPVSALGFGCASLGSRISRKTGIAAIEPPDLALLIASLRAGHSKSPAR